MRFRITGADRTTGADLTVEVDADSEAAAVKQVAPRMLVERVELIPRAGPVAATLREARRRPRVAFAACGVLAVATAGGWWRSADEPHVERRVSYVSPPAPAVPPAAGSRTRGYRPNVLEPHGSHDAYQLYQLDNLYRTTPATRDEIAEYDRLLDKLAMRFRSDPRTIANQTGYAETKLAEAGAKRSHLAILRTMDDISDGSGWDRYTYPDLLATYIVTATRPAGR